MYPFFRWGRYHAMNAMGSKPRASLPKGQGLLEAEAAPLTPMDKWILSRMAAAVEGSNEGFKQYNFTGMPTDKLTFGIVEHFVWHSFKGV